jgi:hypothetical protein
MNNNEIKKQIRKICLEIVELRSFGFVSNFTQRLDSAGQLEKEVCELVANLYQNEVEFVQLVKVFEHLKLVRDRLKLENKNENE